MDQDVGIVEFDGHLFRIGHEVRAEITTVELHTFNGFELEFEALAFVDGDDAFFADLFHGFGDLLADFLVAIGRDDADLGDFIRTGHVLRTALQICNNLAHGEVNAALEVHRVHAGGNCGHAFAHDRLSEHGGGGGAVPCCIIGLAGDFAQHLGTHVFKLVSKLDILGDGDAILGDARCAEALVEHDIAALGAERDFHGIGERIYTGEDAFAGRAAELYVLGSHNCFSW